MAGSKEMSVMVKMGLNAAGFTTGAQKFSKDAKNLENSIVQGNNAIKKSFSTLTSEALPALGSQFGALNGIFGGVKTALLSLIPCIDGVMAAFIATGIGAIIVAIAVAIMGLISWMKRTDEGAGMMKAAMNNVKAVIETILEKLAYLGSAIVKLFKGDFSGAADDAKKAFTGWGETMKENLDTADKLTKSGHDLKVFNETYGLKREEIEKKIADLVEKSKDKENHTAQENYEANKAQMAAKKELYDLDAKHGQLELDKLKNEVSLEANTYENRQKVNDKQAELIKMQADYEISLKENWRLNNKLYKDVNEQAAREKEQLDYKLNALDKIQAKTAKVSLTAEEQKKANAATQLKTGNMDKPDQWESLSKGVDKGLVDIDKLSTATQFMKELKDGMRDLAAESDNLGGKLAQIFTGAIGKMNESLAEGADNFKKYGQNLKQAVKQIIGTMIQLAVSSMVASALKDWATKIPFGYLIAPAAAAAAGGLAKTAFNSLVGAFADGGILPQTGYALVGERGPEVIKLPQNTQIYSNQQSKSMFGGGQGQRIIKLKLEGRDFVAGVAMQDLYANTLV